MAELLGVISGGAGLASLALQLADSAVKLKRLIRAAKHAPETLDNLAFEMETFCILLQEIERDRQAHDVADSDILTRCVQICERGVHAIQSTVNKLEALIARASIFGKLRTALEEKELTQICGELERAKSSLTLAYQMYTESRRRRDQSTTQSLVTQQLLLSHARGQTTDRMCSEIANLSCRLTDCTSKATLVGLTSGSEATMSTTSWNAVLETRARLSKKAFRSVRVKLKPVFISSLWELCLRRSQVGWVLELRTWNTVPDDAEIFRCCVRGDLAGVQALFQNGLASPLDRSLHGKSPLVCAFQSGHVILCQWILNYDAMTFDQEEILAALSKMNWWYIEVAEIRQDLYRLVFRHVQLEPNEIISSHWWHGSPDECMKIVRDALLTPYNHLPWETRFDKAISPEFGYRSSAQSFLQRLGSHQSDPRIAMSKNMQGMTALHGIASRMFFRSFGFLKAYGWVDFLRNIVEAGGDIHSQDRLGRSPLQTVLAETQDPQYLTLELQLWVRMLDTVGLDVAAYGAEETRLWRPIDLDGHTITRWTYGPKIADWVVHVQSNVEIPIFKLHPPLPPPGAWTRPVGFMPDTLAWQPMEEDGGQFQLSWTEAGSVRLLSGVCEVSPVVESVKVEFWASRPDTQGDGPESVRLMSSSGAQDDDSEIMRLVSRSRRPVNRPRSMSQPEMCGTRQIAGGAAIVRRRHWVLRSHQCPIDFRHRLDVAECGSEDDLWAQFRRCSRGTHDYWTRPWDRIHESLQHFHTQFPTLEKLDALPYQAYRRLRPMAFEYGT